MVFQDGSRVDSGVYIGWFDSETRKAYTGSNTISDQPNFLGVLIEGPSRFGHGFRAGYANADAQGKHFDAESSPRILPDGVTHDWEIHYFPNEAGGNGRITIVFDGQLRMLNLTPGHKAAGATFDRFGLFAMQVGGHHVETYWDDLTFTAETATIFDESAAGLAAGATSRDEVSVFLGDAAGNVAAATDLPFTRRLGAEPLHIEPISIAAGFFNGDRTVSIVEAATLTGPRPNAHDEYDAKKQQSTKASPTVPRSRPQLTFHFVHRVDVEAYDHALEDSGFLDGLLHDLPWDDLVAVLL